jgi:hypothetical protein
MFMKIKGGEAFRRAAQAAPKSAEGARKVRAPSDSGLPLVAGMTALARQTTDQRRATNAHELALPSIVARLSSYV